MRWLIIIITSHLIKIRCIQYQLFSSLGTLSRKATLSGEASLPFRLPSQWGAVLKGKSIGENAFSNCRPQFWKDFFVQGSNMVVTITMAEYPFILKC